MSHVRDTRTFTTTLQRFPTSARIELINAYRYASLYIGRRDVPGGVVGIDSLGKPQGVLNR